MKYKILLGVIGSGKSTLASELQAEGYINVSFAHRLKRFMEVAFNICVTGTQTDSVKKAKNLIFKIKYFKTTRERTYRQMIQCVGEAARIVFGANFWVDQFSNLIQYNRELGNQFIVCDDCRHIEELQFFIKEAARGHDVEFIWCNFRSKRYDTTSNHASEKLALYILRNYRFSHRDIIPLETIGDILQDKKSIYI